ncbi:SH3 domain-containing protein, partial [Brevundimonas sp.]|uniref:SH3 domain-containing protein n=1 Tax=Brevundimonas sp. TaxID=1871086 RepID=UPI003513D212
RQAPAASSSLRATTNLRVRSGPGTNYRQIGSLSAGQSVQATGSQGEWVRLSNGGWVSAHYLTY